MTGPRMRFAPHIDARWIADLALAVTLSASFGWQEYMQRNDLDQRLIEPFAGVSALAPCHQTPEPRRFWFADDGDLSLVIEAVDVERGELITADFVSWPITCPSAVSTAFGRVDLLGADQVDNPASFYGGRPLFVHRTPLSWLRAGCSGVVVLDERRAGARLAGALGNLLAEDLDHARELHRIMGRAFPTSRIRVPASSIHRGAA